MKTEEKEQVWVRKKRNEKKLVLECYPHNQQWIMDFRTAEKLKNELDFILKKYGKYLSISELVKKRKNVVK